MDEVSSVIDELNRIIGELEDIERTVRKFEGIHADKCADAIKNQLGSYYTARKKLQNIDRTQVVEA